MMWWFHTPPPSISHKEPGLLQDWIQTQKLCRRPSWCWPHAHSPKQELCGVLYVLWVWCGSLSLCLGICLYFSKVLERGKQWLLCNSWGVCGHPFICSFIHQSVLSSSMCLRDVWKCTLPTPGTYKACMLTDDWNEGFILHYSCRGIQETLGKQEEN